MSSTYKTPLPLAGLVCPRTSSFLEGNPTSQHLQIRPLRKRLTSKAVNSSASRRESKKSMRSQPTTQEGSGHVQQKDETRPILQWGQGLGMGRSTSQLQPKYTGPDSKREGPEFNGRRHHVCLQKGRWNSLQKNYKQLKRINANYEEAEKLPKQAESTEECSWLSMLPRTMTLFEAPAAYPVVGGRLPLFRRAWASIGTPLSVASSRTATSSRFFLFSVHGPHKARSDLGRGRGGFGPAGQACHSPCLQAWYRECSLFQSRRGVGDPSST